MSSFLKKIKNVFQKKPNLKNLRQFPYIEINLSEELKLSLLNDKQQTLTGLNGALQKASTPAQITAPRNCALYLKTFYQTLEKHESSFTDKDKQTISILCISLISRISKLLDTNKDLLSGNANSGGVAIASMLSFNKNKKIDNYPSTYIKHLSEKTGKQNIKKAWDNLIDKYNTCVNNFEKEYPNYNEEHPQQLITQGKKA